MKGKAFLFLFFAIFVLLGVLGATSLARAATFVPATNHGTGVVSIIPGVTSVTPSGIIHISGTQMILTGVVTIGNTPYLNYAIFTSNEDINSNTGKTDVHMPTVWYLGTGGVSSDGFAGNVQYSYQGLDIMLASNYHIHAVLQGFGSFAGQTLKFDTDNPDVWSGYCIIH